MKQRLNGLIALVLVLLFLGILIGPSLYGIYLAFKASWILGLIVVVAEPSPMFLGWIAIFGHPDVCQKIAAWAHLL